MHRAGELLLRLWLYCSAADKVVELNTFIFCPIPCIPFLVQPVKFRSPAFDGEEGAHLLLPPTHSLTKTTERTFGRIRYSRHLFLFIPAENIHRAVLIAGAAFIAMFIIDLRTVINVCFVHCLSSFIQTFSYSSLFSLSRSYFISPPIFRAVTIISSHAGSIFG